MRSANVGIEKPLILCTYLGKLILSVVAAYEPETMQTIQTRFASNSSSC
jgi:hypothetical protein